MNETADKKGMGAVVALGAAWGLAECALGAGLQACARSVSGSLMTGAALAFIAAAWAARPKARSVVLVVATAIVFKMFDALLLGLPVRSGAIANPAFAFVLEGAAFLALVALVGSARSGRTSGRALIGGGAALAAVAAFPLAGFMTGTAACLAPGTAVPLSVYYAPLAIALSMVAVPLGMRFGERTRLFEGRALAASLAVASSLALMVVFRMI